jgi:hypothetical protein
MKIIKARVAQPNNQITDSMEEVLHIVTVEQNGQTAEIRVMASDPQAAMQLVATTS